MSTQAKHTGVQATTAARIHPPASTTTLPATRASERQQAARLKARSPKTPRITTSSAKWVIGGTRSDERKWLEKILAYLPTDKAQENNSRLLRYMLTEWPPLRTTLHTVATLEKVKLFLIEQGVPYLRQMKSLDPRSTRAQKWEYWNDYSPEGIEQFAKEKSDISEDETSEVTEYENYGTISSVLADEEEEEQASQGLITAAGDTTSTNRPHASGLAHVAMTGQSHVGEMERTSDPVEITGSLQGTTMVPRLLAEDDDVPERLDPQEAHETRSETYRVSQLAHYVETPTGNRIELGPVLRELEGIITQRAQEAATTLETSQAAWQVTILHLQQQVQDQQATLEQRIQEHEHRVLKAETTLTEWEQMLVEQEERLESKEDAFKPRPDGGSTVRLL
jgi:hypothetical protein